MEIRYFKLGIGLPLTDSKVHSQFLDCFIRLRKTDNWIYLRPQFPSQNIADIRNAIVKQAKHAGVTHLLMIDTDQTFDQNLIEDLLTRMMENEYQILGGKVHRRYEPYDPILYEFDEKKNKYHLMNDDKWINEDCVEVAATGGGCLLIDMKVFEKIEYPWFKFIKTEESELNQPIGEDVYFCRKLKEAGISIFVDTKIKIGHLALMEVNEDFYFLTKMLNQVRDKKIEEDKNKFMEV